MFTKRDGFKIIRKKDFDQDGLLRGIRIVGGFQHNQAVKGSVWKFKNMFALCVFGRFATNLTIKNQS